MESLIALIIAIVVLAGSIVTYMTKLKKEVSEIHVMVNSRMSEAMQRIQQLEASLLLQGVELPPRPQRNAGQVGESE